MSNVLGMGNALVDILVKLDHDELLVKFNLPKGSMQLVDHEFSNLVNTGTEHLSKQVASGGSAANTIHGLARLGMKTGFIGKIGTDKTGQFFESDMDRSGIQPLLLKSGTNSGRAMALISPDSERTFATYLGAAVELSPEDIKPEHFTGYQYFHIEGYLVQNHALIKRAVEVAKEKGLKVSLDMASYNVVEDNLDFLREIVAGYVDIVFANEEEAKAFTGLEPEEAVNHFGKICEIAVVKTGKDGSIIKKGNELFRIRAIPSRVIDTTGAGDLYAAGFLYGLIQGFGLQICGELGSLLAGKTIEVIGPKMNDQQWKEIKEQLKIL